MAGKVRKQDVEHVVVNFDVVHITIVFINNGMDISDLSKIATNPNATPAAPPRNFFPAVVVGDIVAVNGQPAKGVYVARPVGTGLTPAPSAGQAIADTTRVSIRYETFEILSNDGTPVGTIMCYGLNGGSTPPGPAFGGQNFAIVGGTGAYLGARGQKGGQQTPQTISPRAASAAEDPGNRRQNGGGKIRAILYVIPMFVPQIVATPSGPAVTHSSDFSLVTASKPAAAGENLSLFLTGLGPTRPGIAPGAPFPSSPLAVVNSPVNVTVNGSAAEVLSAVGYPGAVDGYQVNFRMPQDTAKGMTTIQVSAAWIAGAPVSITVQ